MTTTNTGWAAFLVKGDQPVLDIDEATTVIEALLPGAVVTGIADGDGTWLVTLTDDQLAGLATEGTIGGNDGEYDVLIERGEVELPRAECLCSCGGTPKGKRSRYIPGHDARHHAAIKRAIAEAAAPVPTERTPAPAPAPRPSRGRAVRGSTARVVGENA